MKRWRITWGEHSWTVEDMTGNEAASLETLLGGGWNALDPTVSPIALQVNIATHLAYVTGVDFDVVAAELRDHKVPELLAALSVDGG